MTGTPHGRRSRRVFRDVRKPTTGSNGRSERPLERPPAGIKPPGRHCQVVPVSVQSADPHLSKSLDGPLRTHRILTSASTHRKMGFTEMSLEDSLRRFLSNSESPVLFAGAGVSTRAGLPNWRNYLEYLAQEIDRFDKPTSNIMRSRIASGDYANAAQYYFICNSIPAGQKLEPLVFPLRDYDSTLLESLVGLPFSSIVTTNFDRSLLDTYAAIEGSAPFEVNLHDPTLRAAPFNREHYIARIHGRVEDPENMVLSDQHFRDLLKNKPYDSFLSHLFTHRQILFFGFSFLDPAILAVLRSIDNTFGPRHHGRHLAFIPNDARPDLTTRLARFNIEVISYSSADGHSELWNAIDLVRRVPPELPRPHERTPSPFERAKRYLATVYARQELGLSRKPLRTAIFEGIVAEILRSHSGTYLSVDEIIREFQGEVHLPTPSVQEVVETSLSRLSVDNLCSRSAAEPTRYTWTGPDGSSFDDAIDVIVEGVLDRYVVREGGRDRAGVRQCVDALIRNSLLIRGWDLGAAFAAGQPPEDLDLNPIFNRTRECICFGEFGEKERILNATADLLKTPDSKQARILSELGRISFGVELALEAPHDTIMHALTLPQRIYLDTNILMPAIVPNHRHHNIYFSTISRLLEAAAEALVHVEVVISREFLEEVIGHRRLARQEVALMEPNARREIEMEVMFRGTGNINVFLSGYINISPDSDDADIGFAEYLNRYAPYSTIRELEDWLEDKGILVVDRNSLLGAGDAYGRILYAMEVAFADAAVHRRRAGALIAHDAVQLAALDNDFRSGRRSIFVTADRQIREFVSGSAFSHIGNLMMSHVGLIQFVDLLIGTNMDAGALSGLLWSSRLSTRSEQVRNVLVHRALEQYDEALAMAMPRLVDEVAERITKEGEEAGLKWESDEPHERAKIRRHIESFEDEFFEGMREAIERRRRQGE